MDKAAVTSSPMDHGRSVTPMATAGAVRIASWTRHRLQWATNKATAGAWFSSFLENPFVKRVNRREPMRTVKLVRSA